MFTIQVTQSVDHPDKENATRLLRNVDNCDVDALSDAIATELKRQSVPVKTRAPRSDTGTKRKAVEATPQLRAAEMEEQK